MNEQFLAFVSDTLINSNSIKKLKSLSFSKTGTKRICLHENEKSKLHVMLICLKENVKYPFHKHTDSDELIVAIENEVLIKFLKNKRKDVSLSTKIKAFCILIKKNEVHQVLAPNGNAIFLEIKLGPFDKKKLKVIDAI